MQLLAWLRVKLTGMAFRRDQCEEKITALSAPILEHLLKVLLYVDDVNYHKHVDDIDGWLLKVWEIEPKGFKLKEVNYYNWLWAEKKLVNNDNAFTSLVAHLDKRYGKLPRRSSPEELRSVLAEVYKDFAKDLAAERVPSFKDPL